MKHLSWIWRVQPHAAKWPYLLSAGAVLLFGLHLFFYGHLYVTKLLSALTCVILIILICCLQARRPTVLGWIVTIIPFLAAVFLMATRMAKGDLTEYFVLLCATSAPTVLLIFFRPEMDGGTHLVGVLLLCVLGATGVVAAKKYADYQWRPLGRARGFPINRIPEWMGEQEKKNFLVDDFRVLRRMRDLPPAVKDYFTELDGTRLVMADPGGSFESTDYIMDASVPGHRLVFAGVSRDKCFVHFESGGFAHTFGAELFQLSRDGTITREWNGQCSHAADSFSELKGMVLREDCHPVH